MRAARGAAGKFQSGIYRVSSHIPICEVRPGNLLLVLDAPSAAAEGMIVWNVLPPCTDGDAYRVPEHM